MSRVVWLALFCLAAIGGLAVIRSVVGSSSATRPMPADMAADVSDAAPALPKGDRLPLRSFDKAAPPPDVITTNPAVATSAVAPVETAKRPEAKAKDDIVSWHWHQGSKIVRHRKAP